MKKLLTTILFALISSVFVFAQDATAILKRAYEKTEGNSQYAEMTMQIVRPRWQREISMKFCSLGTEYSMVLITDPVKDKGQTFLMVDNEMWMWNPTISRIVKLGPSMMSQGWMNSDYSNDELLNGGSIIEDYDAKITGSEKVSGKDCNIIELTPKDGTTIIWGKQILWISKESDMILKNEFYDEDDFLVKTHIASDIKMMDGREIPTKFEIIPEDTPNNKTVVIMTLIDFDVKVEKSFFTQQNMQKGLSLEFPK
ncbi:MAG: outer membrane lipoprotein-sorting protein [Bacteroidales bacterium]|nr:outer membrane lipoprotein-sorting protein [Bacteroidales bacterium]